MYSENVGYLEQVHLFTTAEVDRTSSMLVELGKLFSPFSSILVTESASYLLPVFKEDGSTWDFDELVYHTASTFATGRSTTQMPLSVISLSRTTSPAEEPNNISASGSGNGGRGRKKKQKQGKMGGRKGHDEDSASDKGMEGDALTSDPAKLPAGEISARLAEISLQLKTNLLPSIGLCESFQTLNTTSVLTIKTMPPAEGPCQFPKREVEFQKLAFAIGKSSGIAYRQSHIRVHINSTQKQARVDVLRPMRTGQYDPEEKQTMSRKIGQVLGATLGLSAAPRPVGSASVSGSRTNEPTASSETKRFHSQITEQHIDGTVEWGFDIDDGSFQQSGISMGKEVLPATVFEFFGLSDTPEPPPERMDITITNYWSVNLPTEPKKAWFRKLWRSFRSNGSEATCYTNLIQVMAISTVPSELPERSYFAAESKVAGGPTNSTELVSKRQPPVSVDVDVTLDTVNRLNNLSYLKFATLEVSDDCILQTPGDDSKVEIQFNSLSE
ncbi:hypothetical protein H0H81_012249 [Sphagnurus paluster]|uniref:Uncharacterized protein n=1 Tax=Sphagnurus paluster TaxID=117069 RepID=A0A9P7GUA8_9AGAR|nr:hypothetical protein H0H81_012249 [Sphagnurus paluster]